MAVGTQANFLLPSGQQVQLPTTPTTYVDEVPAPAAAPAKGSLVTATELANDMTAGVAWLASRPFFSGYQLTTQSIANTTWTPINIDTEQIDVYAGHSDSVNTSRYYPPVSANISAGSHDYYLATGYVKWGSTAPFGQDLIGGLRLTGSATIVESCKIAGASGHNMSCFVADIMEITSSSDYIEMMGWQQTGSALSTASSAGSLSSLQCRWVGTNRWATQPLPGTPHTWADIDQVTAAATGASPKGGVKVPLNTELKAYLGYLYNPPVARLTSQSTTQSIASGAWTSIQFPTSSIDNYGGWSSGANTKYTVQRAGIYHLIGFAALDGVTSQGGFVGCRWSINGGARFIPGMAVAPANSTTTGSRVVADVHERLNLNDTVELQVQQTSGGSLTVSNGAGNPSRLLAMWEML